jgi:ABC-type phosphate transport system substrate-binding protein
VAEESNNLLTVDFGASDLPLNAKERQAAPGAVQIPETIGSVAVAYNIPGIPTKTLKVGAAQLTGPDFMRGSSYLFTA